jgi:hypothetical protein
MIKAALALLSMVPTGNAQNTCILRQNCVRTETQIGSVCPDPMHVEPPSPTPYAPAPMTAVGTAPLADACPFLNPNDNLCCGEDTAFVMQSNFRSLDAVFKSDCPICAANLKAMWCLYACDPLKIDFRKQYYLNVVSYLGTAMSGGQLMTEVNFNIDSTYACGLFISCQQESFISIAGISSSIAFLDFLGVNGQNTSLSIITFNLTTDMVYPSTL